MKKIFVVLILTFLVLVSNKSHANFGYGFCCSGALCGIIPCDTACSGQAFLDLGTSTTNSLTEATKKVNDINVSVNQCAQTKSQYWKNLSENREANYQIIMKGLDGLNKVLVASFVKAQAQQIQLIKDLFTTFKTEFQLYNDVSHQRALSDSLGNKGLSAYSTNIGAINKSIFDNPDVNTNQFERAEYVNSRVGFLSNLKPSPNADFYLKRLKQEANISSNLSNKALFTLFRSGLVEDSNVIPLLNSLTNHSNLTVSELTVISEYISSSSSDTFLSESMVQSRYMEQSLSNFDILQQVVEQNEPAAIRDNAFMDIQYTSLLNRYLQLRKAHNTFIQSGGVDID